MALALGSNRVAFKAPAAQATRRVARAPLRVQAAAVAAEVPGECNYMYSAQSGPQQDCTSLHGAAFSFPSSQLVSHINSSQRVLCAYCY